MSSPQYVIIGNSAAAVGAVEGIRQIDRQGEITLIADAPHHTYSRPLISYLLAGKLTEDQLKYRSDTFYTDHRVDLLQATATAVDAAKKQVILSDGRRISFDKLLVATGSMAYLPPVEGLSGVPDRFTFMSLDDARGLSLALGPDKRVLILGARLIGLKCAEGLSGRVARVTMLDNAPRILSSILDDGGAKLVQDHLESRGLTFKLAAAVKRLEQKTAVLENGERLDFDLLVLAMGVRQNTALLQGIAEIDRGIVINGRSETTAPDIYAAGDCAQTRDVSSGRSRVMAILPNAYLQGECAGINMAGGTKSYAKFIPMNAVSFFGLHIVTAGSYTGHIYAKNGPGLYKRLFYSDNKLNGYILIGNVAKAGIYTSLIRERTPLDQLDFALICEKPGLMAFTQADRAVKLGGSR